ncbi:aromatic ring-hydroxylating oxygenase subunit alpha [Haloarcula amylovorans]|uniref:aromatic ring-hydroxylating oxygenase subunit alpha n=1 Tax=Haloarcula amylovorans TaxID=2562280 RepID=UPI001ADDD695|nr:Rieske 2Fe-2S domain-containing protein [Halomicroarcula amylolytica]
MANQPSETDSGPATEESDRYASRVDEKLAKMGAALDNNEVLLEILHDKDIFEQELDRIFGQTWVYIGHESEIPEKGDYRRRYIGKDPFIFVRDENGDVQVLWDSCRHRGATVCRAEKGNTTHFRCAYHGWTYRNTGELIGVPQKGEGFPDLDPDQKGLHKAPNVESYHGLVFAAIAPDVPDLEEFLGPATWYLDLYFKFIDMEVIGDPHRWEVDTDWKTPAENFAGDNYHIPMGHKSAIDVGIGSETAKGNKESDLYAITGHNGHNFSIYQIPGEDFFWGHPPEIVETFNEDSLTDEQYEVARQSGVSLGTIFPNLSFIHLGGSNDPDKPPVGLLSLRQWQPVEPGKMEAWSWTLAPKDAPEEYKARVHEVGTGTFSPSGNFEVDDVGIWNGIPDSAESVFAEKVDATTVFSMGSGDGAVAEIDEGWPGPGTAYIEGGKTDVNQRDYYRQWHETMSKEE